MKNSKKHVRQVTHLDRNTALWENPGVHAVSSLVISA
jgi:hypothetical protein